MTEGSFILKIISQSNEVILEEKINKYIWLTDTRLEVRTQKDKKIIYTTASFLVIIEVC